MSARAVHALVAAGLHDPSLLAQWAVEPAAMGALRLDEGALDVATLRKFSGLVAMVRHNGLREDLPRTFRLLSSAGLGIEVFADYAAYLAAEGRRLAGSPAHRAAALAAFVGGWIDGAIDLHRRLHDLIRHEAALVSLGEVGIMPPPPRHNGRAAPGSIPVVIGALILHRFDHDPRGSDLRAGDTMLGYWRGSADAPVHILGIDTLCFELLRRLNGREPVSALAQALTGSVPSRAFLAAIDELARIGVVALVRP